MLLPYKCAVILFNHLPNKTFLVAEFNGIKLRFDVLLNLQLVIPYDAELLYVRAAKV